MITPRPHPDNEEMRPVRMSAVAEFLATKQLSEFELAQIAKCMSKQHARNEDILNRLAEPYYRGDLVQLLEVLDGLPLDAQGNHEIAKAVQGVGPFGSPKMHLGFLMAACRRNRIALQPFETRRIERPTPKIHVNAGRFAPGN
ncbi:hypothetical protein NKY66_11165 [Sinorhizobium meliloti]|uniref:hypothetical protein n=1 Tax=Rhizobium meliloti TaxID=382 RepID=UPI003D650AC1